MRMGRLVGRCRLDLSAGFPSGADIVNPEERKAKRCAYKKWLATDCKRPQHPQYTRTPKKRPLAIARAIIHCPVSAAIFRRRPNNSICDEGFFLQFVPGILPFLSRMRPQPHSLHRRLYQQQSAQHSQQSMQSSMAQQQQMVARLFENRRD